NSWYEDEAQELLPKDYVCPHCGSKKFTKETNTLDGWFDSGSSHFAVIHGKEKGKWPADLYLEGADQYRGWFQSSLLTAVGAGLGGAPFKAVLTHGWTVDGEGKAMHKSLGNTIAPDEIIKKYGAELVRLWVASSDYRVDVRVSDNIFKQLSETYRKIRNTARILMANLNGFNPDTDIVPIEKLQDIDKWALSRMNALAKAAREAYDNYEFHIIYHGVNNFCTTDMSKLYVDITKDRVYTEKADSEARRSAQTAMWYILSALTRLIAPLISFTAEEIWREMPHLSSENKESVFLYDMPEWNEAWNFAELEERWSKLFDLRDDVMKALEIARANKLIGKSLDAKITLYMSDETKSFVESFGDLLPTVFIVSDVQFGKGNAPEGAHTETESGIAVLVEQADGEKCDRCWMYTTTPIDDGEGKLCPRCKRIIDSL
ncbi:MAG: class I tRNA ligase family protein, partial [Clostridia bacterium]|nr:class I tRNA ligase family protein [Clostridia bacterium]